MKNLFPALHFQSVWDVEPLMIEVVFSDGGDGLAVGNESGLPPEVREGLAPLSGQDGMCGETGTVVGDEAFGVSGGRFTDEAGVVDFDLHGGSLPPPQPSPVRTTR